MFESKDGQASQSLLMRASASIDKADADQPAQDQHRRARARRRANRPNPLLAALGTEPDQSANLEHQAEDFQPTAQPVRHARQDVGDTRAADDGAPLIDPLAMLQTVWRWRYFIAACTLIGAVLGVMVALSMPTRYTAYSQLLLDPREIQLLDRDLEREFLSNEAALAIVDSRLALATSRPVLETVIERTNLDQDPEFNGTGERGLGLTDGIDVIRSLFTAETPVEASNRETLENLRSAIRIDRTTRTFVVNIGVEASTAQKAALLANEVTRAFVEAQSEISAEKAGTASQALQNRLGELRERAEAAERRVEQFRLENDLVTAQGRVLSDDDLAAANARLSQARAETARARAKAEAASASTVDDAIAGGLPADLVNATLGSLRAQLSTLRQEVAQLQNQLGPRHPRLTSLQAAVDTARQEVATELRRIVAGAQAELRRAVQNEQELAAEAARARAVASNSSDALVELRDLQGEAESARTVYNSALLRTRETGELEQLGTINATVLTEAEPPLHASSVSRRVVAVAGTMIGFLIGMGCAIAAGLLRSVRLDLLNSNTPRGGRPRAQPNGPSGPPTGPRPGAGRPARQTKTTTAPPPPIAAQEANKAMYPPYSSYPYGPFPQVQPIAGYPQPPQQAWPPMAAAPPQPWQPVQAGYVSPWPHPAAPMAPVAYPPPQPHYPPAAYPMPPYPAASYPPQLAPAAMSAWPGAVAAAAPEPPATPEPAPSSNHDDCDMTQLRQSLRDIRDVVDALADRRAGRYASG